MKNDLKKILIAGLFAPLQLFAGSEGKGGGHEIERNFAVRGQQLLASLRELDIDSLKEADLSLEGLHKLSAAVKNTPVRVIPRVFVDGEEKNAAFDYKKRIIEVSESLTDTSPPAGIVLHEYYRAAGFEDDQYQSSGVALVVLLRRACRLDPNCGPLEGDWMLQRDFMKKAFNSAMPVRSVDLARRGAELCFVNKLRNPYHPAAFASVQYFDLRQIPFRARSRFAEDARKMRYFLQQPGLEKDPGDAFDDLIHDHDPMSSIYELGTIRLIVTPMRGMSDLVSRDQYTYRRLGSYLIVRNLHSYTGGNRRGEDTDTFLERYHIFDMDRDRVRCER